MSPAVGSSLYPRPINRLEESIMTATYTFDVFSSLDGYGSHSGDWGGYWGKQGPELLDRRLSLHNGDGRMVFGANTFREFVSMLAASTEESDVRDPWVTRMRNLPATVISQNFALPPATNSYRIEPRYHETPWKQRSRAFGKLCRARGETRDRDPESKGVQGQGRLDRVDRRRWHRKHRHLGERTQRLAS